MREYFQSAFQLEETPKDNEGEFRGYASVFNVEITDCWIPTIIRPGAFSKTLQEQSQRVKILYQHDRDELIGHPRSMVEDARGLDFRGYISATTRGLDVRELMRDGSLDELSIGWDPIKTLITERPGQDPLREVFELRLWEVSPVTWAAQPLARVTEVYAAQFGLMINKLIEAEQRPGVREALARIAAERSSLLLRGLSAVAGELVITDDIALGHYTDMLANAEPEEALRLMLGPVLQLETWAGKVLSAKNKQLVQEAIAALEGAGSALTALLDAAEPKATDDESAAASLTARLEQLRAAKIALAGHTYRRAA